MRGLIATRGKPSDAYCDNVNNLVGAKNSLKGLNEFLISNSNQDKTQTYLTAVGCGNS